VSKSDADGKLTAVSGAHVAWSGRSVELTLPTAALPAMSSPITTGANVSLSSEPSKPDAKLEEVMCATPFAGPHAQLRSEVIMASMTSDDARVVYDPTASEWISLVRDSSGAPVHLTREPLLKEVDKLGDWRIVTVSAGSPKTFVLKGEEVVGREEGTPADCEHRASTIHCLFVIQNPDYTTGFVSVDGVAKDGSFEKLVNYSASGDSVEPFHAPGLRSFGLRVKDFPNGAGAPSTYRITTVWDQKAGEYDSKRTEP
jgi:hypothetical protein